VDYIAAVYPITIAGHASSPFVGPLASGYTGWVINMPGDDVQFEWTGEYWAIKTTVLG
jgi:hypothetical protein